jgi:hypothetical protein
MLSNISGPDEDIVRRGIKLIRADGNSTSDRASVASSKHASRECGCSCPSSVEVSAASMIVEDSLSVIARMKTSGSASGIADIDNGN